MKTLMMPARSLPSIAHEIAKNRDGVATTSAMMSGRKPLIGVLVLVVIDANMMASTVEMITVTRPMVSVVQRAECIEGLRRTDQNISVLHSPPPNGVVRNAPVTTMIAGATKATRHTRAIGICGLRRMCLRYG